MAQRFTEAELECYLDEALPAQGMARLEAALRADPKLAQRLLDIHRRRDAGVHSLGEVWRRHRISCPSRQELGNYLLGVLDEPHAAYIGFHVHEAGCRLCGANLQDMQQQHDSNPAEANKRREKIFRSSAGYLKRKRK
jgi:hypothetical protein